MDKINATDNEELATQAWRANKRWDDELGQWVPVKEGDSKLAGEPLEQSSKLTGKTTKENVELPQSNAPTTENPSTSKTMESDSASSTVGNTRGTGSSKK